MSFRIEQKVPVSLSQGNSFIQDIFKRGGERLFPNRIVRSVYFDNISLKLYHDSEEGLLPRKKYRIRSYPSENIQKFSLEKKISSIEGRFKTTEIVTAQKRENLLNKGIFDLAVGLVFPSIVVQYDRQYFELNGIRITLDTNIQYENPKSTIIVKDPMNVVELKCGFGKEQVSLDEILSSQRGRFSKYCRGIQHTNPQL